MRKFLTSIPVIIIAVLIVGTSTYAAVKILGAANRGLVLDWKMDEGSGTTLTDNSGNGKGGTLNGGTPPSWVDPGRFGKAVSFDGVDQYAISDAPIASLGIIDQPYTISTWVKIAPGETEGNIIHISNNSNGIGWCIPFMRLTSGKFTATSYNSGAVNAQQSDTPTTDTWHHVVETWGPVNGLRLYVDGVLKATTSQSNFTAANQPVYVQPARGTGGCDSDTGFFNGSIDDTRVYDRELSQNKISALYSSNTDAVATIGSVDKTDLIGWWTLDSRDINGTDVRDKSDNHVTGDLVGGATSIPGKIGQALALSGSGNYFSIPNSFNSLITGNDITVSAWIKPNGSSFSQDSAAIVTEAYEGDETVKFSITTNTNQKITTGFFDGSWHYVADPDDFPFATGWVHVAATYDGVTLKLYINDVLKAQQTYNLPLPNGTEEWFIGKRWDNPDFIDGGIDDVRIYNRTLSESEIDALYRTRQTTVNDSRNTRIADGLAGLWSFDGPDVSWSNTTTGIAYDRSGNGNNGSLINMYQATSPVSGKLGQALNFNGTSSCITTNAFIFNNPNEFTIAGWIYLRNYGDTGFFGQNNSIEFGISSGDIKAWTPIASVQVAASVASLNRWHHIAIVGGSSGESLYVDGVAVAENPSPTGNYGTDTPDTFSIGCNVWDGIGDYFNGKIDDVRAYTRALSASEIKQLYLMGK